MLLLNNLIGTLFLDWNPFEPVGRVLSAVGLTEDEVKKYDIPFEEFRHQEAGKPLNLPEDIRTSDDWFRLLFRQVIPSTTERTDDDGNNIKEYGEPNQGFVRQINLDNIGRDFLCLIYYRQRVLDLFRRGGLSLVLTDLFRMRDDDPLEYVNLNNSLIPVEALTDFLTLRGTEFPTDRGDDPMIILSDPPTRHLSLRDVPSVVSMLRDSSNLSRFIRSLSVLLQDGGRWEHLTRVSFREFNLDERVSTLRDRRRSVPTGSFGLYVSMSREFCLWDIHRDDRLPSIRQISDGLGIPYPELLKILLFGKDNSGVEGIHRFGGLEFLREGFSDRLVQMFVRDIEGRSPEELLTNDSKPDIL